MHMHRTKSKLEIFSKTEDEKNPHNTNLLDVYTTRGVTLSITSTSTYQGNSRCFYN